MNIICEIKEQVTVASVSGSIDAAAKAQFGAETTLQARSTDLVIDLAGVDFIDSAGLGGLVLLIRSYREAGKKCILASPSPQVSRIFKVTAIHQMVPVEATVESALLLVKGK